MMYNDTLCQSSQFTHHPLLRYVTPTGTPAVPETK